LKPAASVELHLRDYLKSATRV